MYACCSGSLGTRDGRAVPGMRKGSVAALLLIASYMSMVEAGESSGGTVSGIPNFNYDYLPVYKLFC